ncbi:MAG: glycoside hydrolase family 2 protein [Proteobacteria bacterium]|uniref:glycosyl hydrolase 2 galactose-binding domain-containing protein n=1 Tax=Rudaea sp. TaxID=2136325 RepID=UPI00321F8053|nr:glycoside hydrolase family 2 protein [Pseudomonadota bacterium]
MNRARCADAHRRITLDAGWQVAEAPAGSELARIDALAWVPARVPGTAAGALRAANLWDWDRPQRFDDADFWWRVRFAAEPGSAVLGFEGLATLADVWLDGEHLLASASMFLAHEIPVEFRGEAEHELVIRCRALTPELAIKRPRPRWRVPMLEHQQLRWIRTTLLGRTPGWSPPCPPVGPWRPAWIEYRALQLGAIDIDVALSEKHDIGEVEVAAELDARIRRAVLVVERDGKRDAAALAPRDGRWRGSVRVADPELWWPHTHGEPALYTLAILAATDDGELRIELGRTGFRRIELDRGDGADFRLRVNGVPMFCRGACWTPLDAVTLGAAPEAYRAAIAQARAAGMNMLRVGGTMVYEDDAFYDALDEHGILLWQDFMFANMDYPEDEEFVASVLAEVDQQLAGWRARPSLAVLCGNSEGGQQAAMSGAARERWTPALFHDILPARVRALGATYVPSSTWGGAFPHAANAGPASYYGVGAYLRPLDDARRAEVRFASECLAFANIPFDGGMPGGGALRMHQAAWKARSPRDLGAGWDFDDVRDHYVRRLFGIDPAELRVSDHERYLALGRAATGEAMARTFAEWRRARSPTGGGLIWFLRDLWPGAGWGVVDAHGMPKPCWYALRRALAPIAIAISDEGVNGLVVHVFNDAPTPLAARVELELHRGGDIATGRGGADVRVSAHGAIELAATDFFDGFLDLSWAYRFGPPVADLIHAKLVTTAGEPVAETFWFPAGLPVTRDYDVGLAATVAAVDGGVAYLLTVATRAFAQSITIDVPGFVAEDNGFHLAPGQSRTLALRATGAGGRGHGSISALNAERGIRFQLA